MVNERSERWREWFQGGQQERAEAVEPGKMVSSCNAAACVEHLLLQPAASPAPPPSRPRTLARAALQSPEAVPLAEAWADAPAEAEAEAEPPMPWGLESRPPKPWDEPPMSPMPSNPWEEAPAPKPPDWEEGKEPTPAWGWVGGGEAQACHGNCSKAAPRPMLRPLATQASSQ